MISTIDLNSDVGEMPDALIDGREEKLIRLLSSANIACGAHAGNEDSIRKVMNLCKKYNIGIGAHPSYPDKENFGRIELDMTDEEITATVYKQVSEFVSIADELKLSVHHIKPHGALYNAAAKRANIAEAIARGIKKVSSEFILYGLSGSLMIDSWKEQGFETAEEAFADRVYEPDGSLRSRKLSNSLITDPDIAAKQALMIAKEGKIISVTGDVINVDAKTICLHSDTNNAIEIAGNIREILVLNGITINTIE